MNSDHRKPTRESDVEHLLAQATPRGAPAELRQRVMAAMFDELASTGKATDLEPPRPKRRSLLRSKWALPIGVTTALLSAVLANLLIARSGDARLARVLGPKPPSRAERMIAQNAEMLRPILDEQSIVAIREQQQEMLRRVAERKHGIWNAREAREQWIAVYRRQQEQIAELQKEICHVTSKTRTQVDADRLRSPDHGGLIDQRLFRLDDRCRACRKA